MVSAPRPVQLDVHAPWFDARHILDQCVVEHVLPFYKKKTYFEQNYILVYPEVSHGHRRYVCVPNVSQGTPEGTFAFPMVSSYIMYLEGVLMIRMFLQVSLNVSLFPHVHRRHLKVYVTVVAEGILQGISQGCSQGATQTLSHDIFDPGLSGQEGGVLHVDALVARRVHVGGSSHGDP